MSARDAAGTPGQAAPLEVTHDPEIPVHLVQLWLCDPCLDGEGEQCHTPGCSLWIHDVPKPGLRGSQGVTILGPALEPFMTREQYAEHAAAAAACSASGPSEAAVQAAAEVLFRDYESQYTADHLTWRDFADPARQVLRAALASITGEQPAPGPPAASAALARVLAWFTADGTGIAYRTATVTRAQLAGAYQDGGLDVPQELAKFSARRKGGGRA